VAGRDRETQNALYDISVGICGAGIPMTTCFMATATAKNAQVDDSCTTLTITSTGARGATGDTTDECWQR